MQGDDIRRDAAPLVPRRGDAGVLGGDAETPPLRVGALCLAGTVGALRLDEPAGTVAHIEQLELVETRLDERVASAQTAGGASAGYKGGCIGGAHDHILHRPHVPAGRSRRAVGAAHDKAPARIAQLVHREPRRLKSRKRVRKQRPLGHRYAQGVLVAGTARCRAASPRRGARRRQLLEREGEASGGHVRRGCKRALERGVVPTSRPHGVGKPRRIDLEHKTRVIRKRAHDGKVEREGSSVYPRPCELVQKRAQLVCGPRACARRRTQGVDLVEHLDTARQARHLRDGPRKLRSKPCLGHALVQVDQVVGVHEGERVTGELRIVGVRQQGRKGAHAPAHQAHVGNVERLESGEDEPHGLGIAHRSPGADELEAELGELARAARQAHPPSHHGRLVAQTQRQGGLAQARRHETRDRARVVGAHHHEAPIVIKQLKWRLCGAAPPFERRTVLQKRRLDRQVTRLAQYAAYGIGDILAHQRLLGQDIAKSPRRS